MAPSNLNVFQVIADPSRREILAMLTNGSQNINSIAENFDMSRPAVSKHIKILKNARFLSIKEIGRERHCYLNADGFKELQSWINHFDNFWNTKLQNLEIALNKKGKTK